MNPNSRRAFLIGAIAAPLALEAKEPPAKSSSVVIENFSTAGKSLGKVTLPRIVKTDEEVGAPKVPGQADSAPHRFDLTRHLLRAALLAVPMFAIYYANWHYGWVTVEDMDFYN